MKLKTTSSWNRLNIIISLQSVGFAIWQNIIFFIPFLVLRLCTQPYKASTENLMNRKQRTLFRNHPCLNQSSFCVKIHYLGPCNCYSLYIYMTPDVSFMELVGVESLNTYHHHDSPSQQIYLDTLNWDHMQRLSLVLVYLCTLPCSLCLWQEGRMNAIASWNK